MAVYDAVVCLPSEICRLIDDYREKPHTWTADGTVAITVADSGSSTTIVSAAADFFQTLVSSSSFAVGYLQFTVEFDIDDQASNWIGIGVSRSAENRGSDERRTKLSDLASKDDWIVAPINRVRSLFVHNGQIEFFRLTECSTPAEQTRFRMDVAADPTGIRMAVFRFIDGQYRIADEPKTLLQNRIDMTDWKTLLQNRIDDMTDWSTLRPCIVLTGDMKAVVRSGTPPVRPDD